MSRLRRSLAWAGASAGLVAGLGAAAWLWYVPSKVRELAVVAVDRRLGLDASIGDVSVELDRIVLHSVELRGKHGGLSASAGEVVVEGALSSMVADGAGAVTAVFARRVEVAVDGGDPGYGRTLGTIRDRRGSPVDDAVSRGRAPRRYRVEGLSLRVRDELGELVTIVGGEVEKQGDNLSGRAEALVMGGDRGHRLEFGEVEWRLARDEDMGWQIVGAEVGRGAVSWAQPVQGAAQQPVIPGLFDALPEDGDADVADGHAEEPSVEPGEVEVAAAEVEPSLPARLRALVRDGDPELPTGGGTAAGDAAAPDLLARGLDRLAQDATVEFREIAVSTRAADGEEPVMSGLSARFEVPAPGRLALSGRGTPSHGGALSWDLTIVPDEVRGEGTIGFEELPLALVSPLFPAVPWYEPENASLSGSLRVEGDGAEQVRFEGRIALAHGALSSPRIAAEPIREIAIALEGAGSWRPAQRRLELAGGTLTMGGAHVALSGAVERTADHYRVALAATLPPTPCDVAIAAIPDDLLAETAGFEMRGRIGGQVSAEIDSRDLDAARLTVRIADGCEFVAVPAIADLRRVQGPFTHRVHEPDGSVFEMVTGPGTGSWVPIYDVSPYLVHAVLAHEDAGFFRHSGFSPSSIRDALVRNLQAGRYVYGASTISMQLAKNLFLHREKTLGRKVQEVLLTWWLETALEKHEILELYLNVIEYGPEIYGIRNASLHYFGREPAEISPAEAAFLASILPNPKRYHSDYDRGVLSASMAGRVRRFVRHMASRGRIDEAALDFGLAEVDGFHFHTEGSPPPPPREIPGSASPLPFEPPTRDDAWDEWEEPGEEPDGGDDEPPSQGFEDG